MTYSSNVNCDGKIIREMGPWSTWIKCVIFKNAANMPFVYICLIPNLWYKCLGSALYQGLILIKYISMAWRKTVPTPVRYQRSYCSLALISSLFRRYSAFKSYRWFKKRVKAYTTFMKSRYNSHNFQTSTIAYTFCVCFLMKFMIEKWFPELS